MNNEEAKKSLNTSIEYLTNLATLISDGPLKFNSSEPVMQHLNCLWARLQKLSQLLESEPEQKINWHSVNKGLPKLPEQYLCIHYDEGWAGILTTWSKKEGFFNEEGKRMFPTHWAYLNYPDLEENKPAGEFTKELRDWAATIAGHFAKPFWYDRFMEACALIDRLEAENEDVRKKFMSMWRQRTSDEKKIEQLQSELTEWRSSQDRRIKELEVVLKAKDEKIESLDSICEARERKRLEEQSAKIEAENELCVLRGQLNAKEKALENLTNAIGNCVGIIRASSQVNTKLLADKLEQALEGN